MTVQIDPARVNIIALVAFVLVAAALILGCDAFRTSRARRLPRGTIVRREIPYVTRGHARQKLDIYIPKGIEKPPLMVLIHGGSFTEGDKRDEDAAPWLEEGYAVAAPNYRLLSDAGFPAQVEDCKAAVRWLRANASAYGYDPGRFGARGSSAGGYLVTMLGVTGARMTFDVGERLDVSSRVQAVADRYGPIDCFKDQGANLIDHITPECPPFIIVHGDSDPLVPHRESELLAAALAKAHVPVTLYTVKGGGHGGFDDPGAEAAVREFFERHLKTPAK
jgi:acetyl esterase/lipase